jgi:hypothetical protein
MPEERDIEKSLRAWAKRRREDPGAPVGLHPATRRLLQAEVSRLKGVARQPPGLLARLLWGSPLRLTLNLAAAATVLVAGAFLLPRFWQNPSSSATAPALLAQTDRKFGGNANIASPSVAKDELNAPQPEGENSREASKKADAETTPVSNGPASLADNRSMIETPVTTPTPVPTAAMPATPPVLDQDKLTATNATIIATSDSASATTRSLNGIIIAQKFFRLGAQTEAGRPEDLSHTKLGPETVLNSFQMEQTGGQLRVIDADGSVYTGSLIATDKMLNSDLAGSSAQSRSFRVTGTNLTRNQLVVFTGSLVFDNQSLKEKESVSATSASAAPSGVVGGIGGGGGGGFGAAATFKFANQTNVAPIPAVAPAAASTPTPLLNFRIEGRALIGTNEIQINALPSRP